MTRWAEGGVPIGIVNIAQIYKGVEPCLSVQSCVRAVCRGWRGGVSGIPMCAGWKAEKCNGTSDPSSRATHWVGAVSSSSRIVLSGIKAS